VFACLLSLLRPLAGISKSGHSVSLSASKTARTVPSVRTVSSVPSVPSVDWEEAEVVTRDGRLVSGESWQWFVDGGWCGAWYL